MWARVVEFMLGCWLAVSPFVFQHPETWLWAMDFTLAVAVTSLAAVSYWPPMRHAHLGVAAAAVVMIIVGRFASTGEPSAAHQNYILVGILLAMFAIVPNNASQPPRVWRSELKP